jgi:membrane protease YdiL (CAAX protease family)
VLFSSTLFGLAHWYQGPSGVLSTAVVGVFMGIIFIWAGFNLWVVIFTHAFIDTISLVLVYSNQDRKLKYVFLKPRTGLPLLTNDEDDEHRGLGM